MAPNGRWLCSGKMLCHTGRGYLASFLLFILLILASASAHAALDFTFNYSFSGTTPSTQGPWVTASLSQSAANQVELTITLPSTLPSGTFLDTFYLNYNPSADASLLTVTGAGISGKTGGPVNWNASNNAFKADGDGSYDIELLFPTSHSSPYLFSAPNTVTYFINGPSGGAITPDSFLYTSVGGAKGAFFMAAHLQGYGNSAWVAAPEANFGLASALALLGFALPLNLLKKRGTA